MEDGTRPETRGITVHVIEGGDYEIHRDGGIVTVVTRYDGILYDITRTLYTIMTTVITKRDEYRSVGYASNHASVTADLLDEILDIARNATRVEKKNDPLNRKNDAQDHFKCNTMHHESKW